MLRLISMPLLQTKEFGHNLTAAVNVDKEEALVPKRLKLPNLAVPQNLQRSYTDLTAAMLADKEEALVPKRLKLPTSWGRIERVCAGGFNSFAVAASGRVMAWGLNASGQLGVGSSTLETQVLAAAVVQLCRHGCWGRMAPGSWAWDPLSLGTKVQIMTIMQIGCSCSDTAAVGKQASGELPDAGGLESCMLQL